MKIIAIHKNLVIGGAEKILLDFAKMFYRDKKKLDIVLLENRIEFEELAAIKIFSLAKETDKKDLKLLFLFFWPFYLIKLMLTVKNYDLIFSFERYPAYLNFLLSKLLSKKSCIYVPVPIGPSINDIFKNKLARKLHLFLHGFILKKTDLVIAISKGVKREITKEFGVAENKVQVVEPIIDPAAIKLKAKEPLAPHETELLKNKKVLISIARLNSQKNLNLLIEAFSDLKKTVKNTVLLIIGGGKEKKKLAELISTLNLKSEVILLGSRKNPIKYLSKADLFILPSRFEGLGIVLLEALVCGIPIIAVDSLYGIREVVAPELSDTKPLTRTYNGSNGILIPQNQNSRFELVAALRRKLINKRDQGLKVKEIMVKFRPDLKYRLLLKAFQRII